MRALLGWAAALTVGLAGGSAYAFVVSNGTGSGSGTSVVGTARSLSVEPATGTVTDRLAPGGSGDLVLKLDNPNPSPLTLVGLRQDGAVTVVGGQGCTAADAGVSVPSQGNLSLTVGSGIHSVTVPDGAAMSSSSANSCQGASFQIHVLVRVHQR